MAEPADRILPPLPDDDRSGLPRSPFAMLVVAGLVIATLFAGVAAFTTSPQRRAQPMPYLPGPVSGSTTKALPTSTVPAEPSAAPESPTPAQPTTTGSRRPPAATDTAASTREQAAPPPAPATPPAPRPPVARFTFDCQLSGLACKFDASGSSDPDGHLIFYAWAFGDGESDEGANPSHNYDSPGSYTVTLLVMDDDGKTANISRPVTVSSSR